MTEKRFIPIFDGTDKRVVGAKDNGKIISFMGMFDLLNDLSEENEQLKEALREELQDNGNSYYINLFDELFNLNYREWDENEPYRECIDWEKILKEKVMWND